MKRLETTQTKGHELLYTCPVCGHHKRKFSVNLDKNVYKCWVCDYRGVILERLVRRFGTFVQLQKMGLNYKQVRS